MRCSDFGGDLSSSARLISPGLVASFRSMKKSAFRVSFGFILLGLLTALPISAKSSIEDQRNEVREMRDEVLAELYKAKPETKARIKKAKGYAVFTNIGINVIFASVAGGKGVVVDRRGKETFMKMGSAGLGIGLGVKDFRGIFIFYDQGKMNDFIQKGWDFSAQADAAAKSDDKGGQAALAGNLADGVEVYQFTKNGLALQATLQGTKYWRNDALN
jgi:lipid-binding SYLF domain-containing protein